MPPRKCDIGEFAFGGMGPFPPRGGIGPFPPLTGGIGPFPPRGAALAPLTPSESSAKKATATAYLDMTPPSRETTRRDYISDMPIRHTNSPSVS